MAEPTQTAIVLSSIELTSHVRQLVLLQKESPLSFQAGQWISLKLPVGTRPPLNRAYSMAVPGTESGELTLVFDRVDGGIGSEYLCRLKAGDEVIFSGPHGHFVLPTTLDKELVFVARYTGLVPIRCMLKILFAKTPPLSVLVIAVGPREDELLFHQELLTLAMTHSRFRYLPLVAAGGEQQAVDLTLTMLQPLIEGAPKVIPMLCGTKAFVRPLRAFFVDAGYERKEVKTETYD
ncbi:putative Ferredoxin reductase [Nitrospira sp. KM1]|uniref:ferredoxin--NADP reductase n=1 Tax=Nitrospira sp. KM1 TaxID=1936990 RepID=UPI0013A7A629|nr:FAD-dependent oxidoreductase [Nitrospira sp. KM1]BCA54864.1 putative Ferredoxin reductase [Nitrospira sp. KM1]